MRSKYVIVSLVIFVVLFLVVFRNIVYAFACNSERIDGHMLSVMVQGAISPSKEFVLEGGDGAIAISLPKGAAEIERNIFLIPSSMYKGYLKYLEETGGYAVEQLGSSILVEVEDECVFHISVTPYTGAYMKLKYSR